MHDVLEFLQNYPPFDDADPTLLANAIAAVEIEYFPAGAVVEPPGAPPSEHVYVVRTGHVELVDHDRMLDLLGPGDLVGLSSLVSGLPTEVGARAAEDLLVYRLPGQAFLPLLNGVAGLRLVAREVATPGARRVASGDPLSEHSFLRAADLVRPALVLTPDTTVREAVEQMSRSKTSGALIRGQDSRLGILTDHDLRNRVLAAGVPVDTSVAEVMTADAITVSPDTDAESALLQMLTLGVRHLPVVDSTGQIVGLVEDLDLLGAQASTPLRLRRRIARATEVAELHEIARLLPDNYIAAYESRLPPRRVGATHAVLIEALARRIVELRLAQLPEPPVPFSLLLSGSAGRRELAPSSDLDTLLVWWGPDDDRDVRRWMLRFAKQVLEDLAASGARLDANGMCASDLRFARSIDAWRDAFAEWFRHPDEDTGLVYLWGLADARAVWGVDRAQDVRTAVLGVRDHPDYLRVVARASLQHRPPTGFVRDLVVEHSGEHRGRLDLKHGGLSPIVDVARYYGIVAGTAAVGTLDRISAAQNSGLLSEVDARHLDEVHEFLTGLRHEHQVAQLRDGQAPDDFLDPALLMPLTRRYLREAFRTIARLQRGVDADLDARLR